MCGIYGYIGPLDAVKTTLTGLKKLEYRGYDSSGIAGIKNGKLFYVKQVGKVSQMEAEVYSTGLDLELAIAQTRWATHGRPNKVNAHPHFDQDHAIAVVHNGIIENHFALRQMLKSKGYLFISDTDTEVVAHLISNFYQGDLLTAIHQSVSLLEGSFALVIIHKDYPDQIVAIAKECPLAVGIGEQESYISSDPNAFGREVTEVFYLSNAEIAIVKAGNVSIFDKAMIPLPKKSELLTYQTAEISKGNYPHYTLKEIYEQPFTIQSALLSRYIEEYGNAIFEEASFDSNLLQGIQRVLVLACGTSYHAGMIGAYMIEQRARIPAHVEIASEFRYKNPVVQPGTLVIAISQSGETADTVAAMREVKAKGAQVIALCNVHNSTIAREADSCIFLKAGPEIGVCSTKAFTSQVAVLSLITLLLARMLHMNKQEGQQFLHYVKELPNIIQKVLDQAPQIQEIAKKYSRFNDVFFLGRNYMYPTSLEGALKLKEIAYIDANGYPAGEMKHGPIALIDENCPTVALCANELTFDKMLSNIQEIKARNGLVFAIAEEGMEEVETIADDIIYIPKIIDELSPIPVAVVTQIFAYYVALERGAEIDQPRNLAKSVTVE